MCARNNIFAAHTRPVSPFSSAPKQHTQKGEKTKLKIIVTYECYVVALDKVFFYHDYWLLTGLLHNTFFDKD